MKIIVCSKKEIKNQWYKDKSWFNNQDLYFITISGVADGLDWAYPFMGSHVLRLKFDDITEWYYENVPEAKTLLLFDKDQAKQIKEFVLALPKDCTLYINCAAGISRSGAIGYCINEFINNDNKEDFKFFEQENSHIQPNPYVKRLLTNEFFGEINWKEVFKNKIQD